MAIGGPIPANPSRLHGWRERGCGCAAQAGQVESAVALWKRMRQEGAQPSADSCNALLTACLDCQQNERALTLFQEMHAWGETTWAHIGLGCTAALLQRGAEGAVAACCILRCLQ